MNRVCWWLADQVSRLLEPDEHDAVRGDLEEMGATGGKALRDLLGLVARRQVALWKDWRPWLALLGIVGPVGLQLGRISISTSAPLWANLQAFWTYGVPYQNGLTIPEEIIVFVCYSLTTALWSWTAGFAVGSLSRRALWVNGVLFCLVWWFSVGPPALFLFVLVIRIPEVIFVVFPFFWGVRRSREFGALGRRQIIQLVAATITMLVLMTWTSGWRQAGALAWSEGVWPKTVDWPTRLMPFAMASWPVTYLLAVATSRRWRKSTT